MQRTTHAIGLGLSALVTLGTTGRASAADVQLALESGAAWQTRNDFRIPGDSGTLVKLAEYDQGPVPAFRATLSWDLGAHQSLRLLAAPLRVETTFTPSEPVVFQDLVFPSGQPIDTVSPGTGDSLPARSGLFDWAAR
jgi:hypothetical protein